VNHEVTKFWLSFEQAAEDAIAEDVRYFIPVAYGVKALERKVVSVVASFSALLRAGDEGGARAFANFLGLGIEDLLRCGLPSKAEVPHHGNHTKPDAAARREVERALVAVIVLEPKKVVGGVVGEVAGGDDVGDL